MQPPPSLPAGDRGHAIFPSPYEQFRAFTWGPNGSGSGNESGGMAPELYSDILDFDALISGGGAEETCYDGGLGEYAIQMPMGGGSI